MLKASIAYIDFYKSQIAGSVLMNKIPECIFLTKGEILTINPSDPKIHTGYYDFSNFIFDTNLDKIGKGAFGDLYLATHKQDNKKYAIKHINKEKVIENNCPLSIIYQEISIQLMLSHPNIVRLYSYHENKTDFYLIEEYVPKGNLFSKIQKSKNKHLSEKQSFRYFIQISSAIYFLHENGFVHRDIKPENILIDNEDNVKLCDFGWCVNLLQNEKRTTFCGTFEYMAPEIVCEEKYDTGVDIWALGILLYEMLHGYSPFRSNQHGEDEYKDIFRNILKKDYVIDNKLKISEECVELIHKLLQENNVDRISISEVFLSGWVKKFEEIEKKKKEQEKKKKEEEEKNKRERLINEANNSIDVFFKESPEEIKKRREMEKLLKEKEEEKEKENAEKKNNDLFDGLMEDIKTANESKKTRSKSKSRTMKKRGKSKEKFEKANNLTTINISNQDLETSNNKISPTNFNGTKSIIKEVSEENEKPSVYNNKTLLNPKTNFNINDFRDYAHINNGRNHDITSNELSSALRILENADKNSRETKKKEKPKKEESFWDKIFSPFKCGD